MNGSSLVTNLLGRRVRMHGRPPGAEAHTGTITTVYLDRQGFQHYVILLDGRLVDVEGNESFIVLDDADMG
ncbi:MAG TPA: hypothetical protein VG013_08895 [Gemmataceae bacterium]|nr:hypothetical protein [Gemmataceae bacterium]